MGSRSMSLEQVSISAILILLLPALGLCGYRPVLPKEDVDRVSVTLPASPRVILRDTPRDNHDKDDGRRVVRRRRVNDIAIILENFDKPTLRSLLINKEKRVGDVILVNGKPAIIRKRRVGPSDEDDIASDPWLKVMVFLKFKLLAGQPLCVTPNWYTATSLSFGRMMMSKSPQLLPHPNAFALLPVILKVCEPLLIEPTQYTLASCHCVVLV